MNEMYWKSKDNDDWSNYKWNKWISKNSEDNLTIETLNEKLDLIIEYLEIKGGGEEE